MRCLVVILLSLSMSLAPGRAADTHQHSHPTEWGDYQPAAPIRYSVAADVDPVTMTAKGMLEITFENSLPGSVTEVQLMMVLPPRWRPQVIDSALNPVGTLAGCWIDSILYRGVPLSPGDGEVVGTDLTITLPDPLPNDQSGFLLISFQMQWPTGKGSEAGGLLFSDWFPRLIAMKSADSARCWFDADYRADITVDSSWSLAHGGQLLNHKELYGPLPTPGSDSVLVDIRNKYRFVYHGRAYHPVFQDGRKHYLIQGRNLQGLPLVLHQNQRCDRFVLNETVIDVCYPAAHTRATSPWVAEQLSRLMTANTAWLPDHLPAAAVVTWAATEVVLVTPTLVVLPADLSDRKLVTLLASMGLVKTLLPAADDCPADSLGWSSNDLLPLLVADKVESQSSWVPGDVEIGQAAAAWWGDRDQDAIGEILTAAAFHRATGGADDSATLSQPGAARTAMDHTPYVEQCECDPQIVSAEVTDRGEEFRVTLAVSPGLPVGLPCEIEILDVLGKSTCQVVQSTTAHSYGRVALELTMAKRPRRLVLDPRCLWFDTEPSNNVYWLGPNRKPVRQLRSPSLIHQLLAYYCEQEKP